MDVQLDRDLWQFSTNTWNDKALNLSNIKIIYAFYLQESKVTNSYFHDDNLMETVLNLFAAGTDTTATTLRWALLLMAKYPKIQGKEQILKYTNTETYDSNCVLYQHNNNQNMNKKNQDNSHSRSSALT